MENHLISMHEACCFWSNAVCMYVCYASSTISTNKLKRLDSMKTYTQIPNWNSFARLQFVFMPLVARNAVDCRLITMFQSIHTNRNDLHTSSSSVILRWFYHIWINCKRSAVNSIQYIPRYIRNAVMEIAMCRVGKRDRLNCQYDCDCQYKLNNIAICYWIFCNVKCLDENLNSSTYINEIFIIGCCCFSIFANK